METNYQKLVQRLEETSRLGGVMGILHWDQEVIMPSGAAESRAMQMGVLAGTIHEKSTDPEIGKFVYARLKMHRNYHDLNIDELRERVGHKLKIRTLPPYHRIN